MSKSSASELVDIEPIDINATLPEFVKAWHDTVASLFKMLELIQAHQNRPGFEKLCEVLDDKGIIKRSVMSMLQRIIANPVLMAPQHRAYLPPSYNTLWILTGLGEDVLEAKIAKKELTPELTVDAARKWKRDLSAPKSRARKKTAQLYASLKIEDTSKLKLNQVKIQKCLDQLQSLGFLVVLNNQFK